MLHFKKLVLYLSQTEIVIFLSIFYVFSIAHVFQIAIPFFNFLKIYLFFNIYFQMIRECIFEGGNIRRHGQGRLELSRKNLFLRNVEEK